MLAIRMQRTGRRGHANFRVVVQDTRQTPTSGKVIAFIGSYDPHTKLATLTKDTAELYLKNGAQPSERVARLFQREGIKLPNWVTQSSEKVRTIRNPEKLRKNRPNEPKPAQDVTEPKPAEESSAVEASTTKQATDQATPPSEGTQTEEKQADGAKDPVVESSQEPADQPAAK